LTRVEVAPAAQEQIRRIAEWSGTKPLRGGWGR